MQPGPRTSRAQIAAAAPVSSLHDPLPSSFFSPSNTHPFKTATSLPLKKTLKPEKKTHLVPVPFSIFPSSYREEDKPQKPTAATTTTTTTTHEELEIKLPLKPGRESQYSSSSFTATADLPRPEEQIRISSEKEYRRPGHRHEEHIHEEHTYIHQPHSHASYSDARIEIDHGHRPSLSAIDNIEREYRARYQSNYQEEPRSPRTTVDQPRPARSVYREDIKFTEEIVESPSKQLIPSKMGHYDSDERREVSETRITRGGSRPRRDVSTVTIPCHHIRLGDILMLQGRACQVIRISTSAATGQHRYLGVDLFTKELREESSSISSPSPSVVVQTMQGPVYKQYRVLDLQDGQVVAMTENGDVKQGLPVSEQSNLWERLTRAFESGRGSVRVLVVNADGRELVCDMAVLHGSRL